MSGMFSSLAVTATGMTAFKSWINAVSDNVANVNTTRPTSEPAFQERFVHVSARQASRDSIGGGVKVDHIEFGPAEGVLVYEPDNPMADEQGMVRRPQMNLSDQMTALILAQRGYQANVTVFERARDAYQRALEIGR